MVQRVEEGWFEVWLGKNANERIAGGRVKVAGGKIGERNN
jgi:hypothetical protein